MPQEVHGRRGLHGLPNVWQGCIHHDVTAWLGPKFQGVLHLSSDEFRQELHSRGSGSTFVNYKEKPCNPVVVAATLGLPLQTEVY